MTEVNLLMSRKERERLAVLAQVKRGKLSYRPSSFRSAKA